MESGKNKRHELYLQASNEVKELYAGEATGDLLWNTAVEMGITGGQKYYDFALAIGDVILGLYKKTSLGTILKERMVFTDDQVTFVTKKLAPLIDQIPENVTTLAPTVIKLPSENIVLPAEEKAPDKPVSTPEDAHDLRPLRTFAMDVNMNRAHSYGAFKSTDDDNTDDTPVHRSSQDDIIKK